MVEALSAVEAAGDDPNRLRGLGALKLKPLVAGGAGVTLEVEQRVVQRLEPENDSSCCNTYELAGLPKNEGEAPAAGVGAAALGSAVEAAGFAKKSCNRD